MLAFRRRQLNCRCSASGNRITKGKGTAPTSAATQCSKHSDEMYPQGGIAWHKNYQECMAHLKPPPGQGGGGG